MRTLLLLALLTTVASATWRPEYAQLDSGTREWFRAQKNPTTNVPCCSEADGVSAQEDIRDGRYWTRFVTREGLDSGWMQVPEDAILRSSNRNGAPVAWYAAKSAGAAGPSVLWIRCYATGAKL
jgi:hypothetical protein